jgi:hypothetical protein
MSSLFDSEAEESGEDLGSGSEEDVAEDEELAREDEETAAIDDANDIINDEESEGGEEDDDDDDDEGESSRSRKRKGWFFYFKLAFLNPQKGPQCFVCSKDVLREHTVVTVLLLVFNMWLNPVFNVRYR